MAVGAPAGPSRGPAGGRSDVFDRRRLAAAEGDTQPLRGPEDLIVGVAQLDGLTVAGQHLDVQAQRLQLLEQHLERLRDARLRDVLALDDRLVHLDAAEDVVGLDRQQLLQRVRGAVGLHRPALHLTEALTAELRLTAQRLLRDHRVRTGRTRVDLVVDQVQHFVYLYGDHRDRLGE